MISFSFGHNEANQVKKVTNCASQTIAEYIYDYDGKRIIKKNYNSGVLVNTVTSWTPSYETKEIVGGSTESTNYYYANGELVARKNNDGTKTYYHTDHLGSTSVLTNQAGNLVESTSCDPYGKVKVGGQQSRFQYTGKEKDQETGLNYYESRYYSSEIRRFVQPDSWLPDIYDPQQLNRYSYANNNPLKYTDPTGHFVSSIFNTINLATKLLSGNNQEQKKSTPPPTSRPIQEVKGLSNLKGGVFGGGGNGSTTTGTSSQGSLSILGTSTNSSSPSTQSSSSWVNSLPQHGNWDVSISSGLVGVLGGGIGTQLDKKGGNIYFPFGLVSPGRGANILYSARPVNTSKTTINLGASLLGAANLSFPYQMHTLSVIDSPNSFVRGAIDQIDFSQPDFSFGGGFPPGFSGTINIPIYTFEWSK